MKKQINLFLCCILMMLSAAMNGVSAQKTSPKATRFFENFEGITDGKLPSGWKTVATPSTDVWKVGGITFGGVAEPGHSGETYALISYKESAHNSWAFSPGINMKAGITYNISFWIQLRGYQGKFEALEVKIGKTATTAAMATATTIFDRNDTSITSWHEVTYNFTPTETNDYYIGFHSYSPADVNCTMFDDLRVDYHVEGAFFEGDTALSLGAVLDINPVKTTTYRIANGGSEDLTISLASKSDELTLTDVPASLEPGEWAEITVSLNTDIAGAYTGNFVLTTNDPAHATVTVNVTADVEGSVLTRYHYETFENKPAGWLLDRWSASAGSGVGGSAAYRASVYAAFEAELITHYVEMGDDPIVSFAYKVLNFDQRTPTPGNQVQLAVLVSEDYGKTYTPKYAIMPGTDNEHVKSAEYATINLPLPEYANKTVRIAIVSSQANHGDYWLYIDNMAIGTKPDDDLTARPIKGKTITSVGVATTYTVTVENTGVNAQTDYTVKLMKEGDVKIDELSGTSLASGEVKTFEFEWTPDAEVSTYLYAEVVLVGDMNVENNKSQNFNVKVMSADVTGIGIGTGSEKLSTPIDFLSLNSASQTLYPAHDMGTNGGLINTLVFKTSFALAHTGDSVKVWIGETEKSDFADATWIPVSELNLIYDDIPNWQAGDNDWEIHLPEPYAYQGGNLVIYVFKFGAPDNTAFDKYFYNTDAPNTARTLALYSGPEMTPENPGSGFILHHYPNVDFYMDMSEMGSISGTVTNADATPLQGVKVEVVGTSLYQITNASGKYTFPTLAAGNYKLRATLLGYGNKENTVVLTTGNAMENIDFTMEEFTKITLNGTVKRADNASPIENASISLIGYQNYETATDATGTFSIDEVYANYTYMMTVAAEGFVTYVDTLKVQTTDINRNIVLHETPLPVQALTATLIDGNSKAEVNWYAPATLKDTAYVLDDGTPETGYTVGPEADVMFGNKYTTTSSGVIQSIDLYGITNPNYPDHSNRTVTAEVYNANRELISASDPFLLPADAWLNVPLHTTTAYSGDFYVMIHWSNAPGYTPYLGLSTSFPFADYHWENGKWTALGTAGAGGIGGVFLLRANAVLLKTGETKVFGNPTPMSYSPKAPMNYAVYRLLKGQPEAEWTSLGNTTDIQYVDNTWETLPNGNYQYAVIVNYFDGKTSETLFTTPLAKTPSGIADEVLEHSISVYPNPVQDILHLQSSATVEQISIYDLNGRLVKQIAHPESEINVSNLHSGIYLLKVRTSEGEIARKMIKE